MCQEVAEGCCPQEEARGTLVRVQVGQVWSGLEHPARGTPMTRKAARGEPEKRQRFRSGLPKSYGPVRSAVGAGR